MADERRRAAVIGHPVGHSRSPAMHNAAYAALGLPWEYAAVDVPPDRLEEFVAGMDAAGFAGVNVTIPHKQAVISLCDELSAEASRAGSVNTLLVRKDGLLGESTDGRGLLWALGEVKPADALVLGAGGAARAAVAALQDAGWRVAVSARRPRAAYDLGAATVPWPAPHGARLVVHATPLGQREDPAPTGVDVSVPIDPKHLGPGTIVVDLAYRGDGSETPLCAAAHARGAQVVDGLDVLLGQGIFAFELLTGRDAPVEVMRRAVRA